MDINLEYYKIFYYVGKKGSITKAANELSISQPAVSQAIRNLEDSLGCPLFVREAKGVRLTGEGEVLFRYVERGYENFQAGERKLTELLNMESGEICIGASDMTLQFYLLPYLEKFHDTYPDIKITVTNAPTPETLTSLSDGKIDFGVVSTPLPEDFALKAIPVREIKDVFVSGNKFRELKGRSLSYKKLEKYPLLCLEGETSTRRYVEAFLAKEHVDLKPEFELATSDMLIQFAERGLGIASVVEDFAAEAIAKGQLFRLMMEKPIPSRQICLVYDEHIPMSTAARKLIELLDV